MAVGDHLGYLRPHDPAAMQPARRGRVAGGVPGPRVSTGTDALITGFRTRQIGACGGLRRVRPSRVRPSCQRHERHTAEKIISVVTAGAADQGTAAAVALSVVSGALKYSSR